MGSIMKASGVSKAPEKVSAAADGGGRDDLEGKVGWIVKFCLPNQKVGLFIQ